MSGNLTPSAKTSRRQRVLAHLGFKGRASSPSPSPSPSSRPNQTVTSSTAQITTNSSSIQDVSSSTAPAGPVLTDLLTAGAPPYHHRRRPLLPLRIQISYMTCLNDSQMMIEQPFKITCSTTPAISTWRSNKP